jgi:hypothetical protein
MSAPCSVTFANIYFVDFLKEVVKDVSWNKDVENKHQQFLREMLHFVDVALL